LSLLVSSTGLIQWYASIIPDFAPLLQSLYRVLAPLRVWRGGAKRGLDAARAAANIRPGLPVSIPHDTGAAALDLSRTLACVTDDTTIRMLIHPLGGALSPAHLIIRTDASPHFGCGGVNLSSPAVFHSPWHHSHHSPEADAISSTLAEAIAALIAVTLWAPRGTHILLQTDSEPLSLAWRKGYSMRIPVCNVIFAILRVLRERGSPMSMRHILRRFNRASDAMASNQPLVRCSLLSSVICILHSSRRERIHSILDHSSSTLHHRISIHLCCPCSPLLGAAILPPRPPPPALACTPSLSHPSIASQLIVHNHHRPLLSRTRFALFFVESL
jgi:hypothetical protein